MPTPATNRAIELVYRTESARLIAALTRLTRDVGVAEELAQDALVSALEHWPASGIPEKPGAWLMATAKRRGLDRIRHQRRATQKHEMLGHQVDLERELNAEDPTDSLDQVLQDDLLRLIFIACHPVLSTEARLALTLRLLGGLSTEEIARAFLSSEPTVAQRIVRAKRTLADESVPYEVPRGPELVARLGSVLEVIYLIYNEGYSATAGDDWMRPTLCQDAMRLGRTLSELLPLEPEVHGLVALMELQASRSEARVGPSGEPILLLKQDRARWDHALIESGLSALENAERLGGAGGLYALQAAIAACHARARTAEETDWPRIALLYYALTLQNPSPVIELNRAVAVSMAFGPLAGLGLVDALRKDSSLEGYHPFAVVRGDLLYKLERFAEAQREFERAAELTKNAREREVSLERAEECRIRERSAG